METQITLGVLRNLENRRQNLPDDSPMAFEAHVQRGAALHEAFDKDANVRVVDWGETDDKTSHEHVSIALAVFGPIAFDHVILPGLKWLGQTLAEKLVEAAISDRIKHVVERLWPGIKAKKIETLTIPVRAGTMIYVGSDGRITVMDSGSMTAFENMESDPASAPKSRRAAEIDF